MTNKEVERAIHLLRTGVERLDREHVDALKTIIEDLRYKTSILTGIYSADLAQQMRAMAGRAIRIQEEFDESAS